MDDAEDTRPLRDQLIEARDRVRHQLETLAPGSAYGTPDNRGVMAELEKELAELEEAIARTG